MPLYALKAVNALLFAVISWSIMDVDSSTGALAYVILSGTCC